GQIPLREVLAGRLDRFGAIDPSEGGNTKRTVGNLLYHWDLSPASTILAQAYIQHYKLNLFSDFTFFLNDPVKGDGIEQDDDRYIYGGDLAYKYGGQAYAIEGSTKGGLRSRLDSVRVGLGKQEPRTRCGPTTEVDLLVASLAPSLELELPP